MIKKSAIATAVALALGTGSAHAAEPMTSATFDMYDPTGALQNTDTTLTGSIGGGTWGVASTTPFFGLTWTAHGGTTFGPGTYSFDTIQGGTYTGIVVGPGQVGGHILFNWGVTADIDVINVWDVNCVDPNDPSTVTTPYGDCTYTSIDIVGGSTTNGPGSCTDTIPGCGMIDGAFPGFNANFDFTVFFPLPGAPTFTPPPDIDGDPIDTVTETPDDVQVTLGTVTDEDPPTATVEYSIDDGVNWTPDDGTSNPITFTLTETVNDLVVDWRAVATGGTTPGIQNVRVTIDDQVAPVITGTPGDAVVDVTTTTDQVCFAGTATDWGVLTADDLIEPNLTIEYSLNDFDFLVADPDADQYCNTDFGPDVTFGPGANTVYWRVSDKAVPNPNVSTYEQTVTLNLPTGIVGKPCTINLDWGVNNPDPDPDDGIEEGFRLLEGSFIMRDPTGGLVGVRDDTVTGEIDTTKLCNNPTYGACRDEDGNEDAGASLETQQAFQGLLWTAFPVYLYGPNEGPDEVWTFETCPDAPDDNSINCDQPDTTLDLKVLSADDNLNNPGVEQLGAHMLFAWGSTEDIDVVVAWDVDCGAAQLTTTDPDGDGILGTRMVDGPFQGFNAAFDVSATGFDADGNPVPLIADGGYTVTVPTYRNPVKGESPLPLTYTELSASELPADDAMVSSCNAGGCYEWETDGVIPASDDNGDYQFVQVALPLDGPIPWYSLYRVIKDPVKGTWETFVPDARNNVKSAPLNADGTCPEPGAGDYRVADANSNLQYMLQPDDQCIQLTVEDDGPYDSADTQPGYVKDPSGVAVQTLAQPKPEADTTDDGGVLGTSAGSGGCTLTGSDVSPLQRSEWGLLAGLLAMLGLSGLRRRRSQR